MAKKLIKGAAEKAGKGMGHLGTAITTLGLHTLLTDKLKKEMEPKPRPILDYCIDHLKDFNQINKPKTKAKAAEENLKKRISTADRKGKENRLVNALCKLLELDRDKDNNYKLEFPLTRKRLMELGLMELKDFKQSIELLVDDPIQEAIKHSITKPISKQVKKIKKQIKKIDPGKIADEIQSCNQILKDKLL